MGGPSTGGADLEDVNGPVLHALVVSLIPGLFWLWYIHNLGRYRKEPWWAVALTCLAGALSTNGVLGFSNWLDRTIPGSMDPPASALSQLFYFVFAVGLVEEGFKMLAVRLTVYNLKTFDEPVDGLLYAGCSALGFATAENVKYVLAAQDPSIMLGRSILATFGHVLMSAVWGYALGMQKLKVSSRPPRPGGPPLLTVALLLAALSHGLYDWLLFQGQPLLAVGVIAGLWRLFGSRIQEVMRLSPYREHHSRRVRECSRCHILFRSEARFCTACGGPAAEVSPGPVRCVNCLATVEPEALACSGCNCRFLDPLKVPGTVPSPIEEES